MTPTDDAAGALADLLEEEREALLHGHLERVGEMIERKEALISEISEAQVAPDGLPRLQEAMARNHVLFEQALAGLRSAIGRVGALQSLRRSMVTYSASGRREDIAAPVRNRLERRA